MIEIIRHYDWHHFADAMGKQAPHESFFRGQQNPDWGLVAGAFRSFIGATNVPSDKKLKEINSKRLLMFQKYCAGATTDTSNLPQQEDELAVWAQNYGLKTELLDWSRSPFVAAFFAFADCTKKFIGSSEFGSMPAKELSDMNISIWELPQKNWPNEVKRIEINPRAMHRQRSQDSIFTNSADSEYPDLVDLAKDNKDWVIKKHLVQSLECYTALSCLKSMNIHYASLFPDLYGAAQQANWEPIFDNMAALTKLVKIESGLNIKPILGE